jgi:hypothetical protein
MKVGGVGDNVSGDFRTAGVETLLVAFPNNFWPWEYHQVPKFQEI